jgi:nucleoside-diphosphate-sugar epimerase
MMLMAYNRVRGFPAVITRTANIYGPGQGANRIIPLAFDTKRAGRRCYCMGAATPCARSSMCETLAPPPT